MPKHPTTHLLAEVRHEAERIDFPVDLPVYERCGKNPREPILFAGSLQAPLCVVGRDLGKDEVRAGQPLIGQAGRLVRAGILAASNATAANTTAGRDLDQALEFALLTNIVPYKPPGNKAYPESVRRRFRPFLEMLLVEHWEGNQLITLGAESFAWFAPYLIDHPGSQTKTSAARFETTYRCRLPADPSTGQPTKEISLRPLPHPSPLNRRWYTLFPSMLASRLSEVRAHQGPA